MRRRVLAGSALLAAAIAFVAWQHDEDAAAAAATTPVVAADAGPTLVSVAATVPLPRDTDVPPGPAKAAPPPDDAPAPRPVCGVGEVEGGPDADERIAEALRHHAEPAIEAWRLRLVADADPRRRAVGLSLGGTPDDGEHVHASLVALALATRDPAVVGIAVTTCGVDVGVPGRGPCGTLDPALWPEVDPGHAEPWLHAAGIAWSRRDAAGADAALRRAAALPYGRVAEQAWFAALRDSAPTAADTAQRYMMAVTMIGRVAALWGPDAAAVLAHCSEKNLLLPGRRLLCEQLADLAGRGPNLIDRLYAGALGGRLGWSRDRIEAVGLESRRAHEAILDASRRADAHACAGMERELRFFERRAELGEIDTLRALRAERQPPR